MKDIRILFLGTPDFAATHLKFLVENNFNVVGVISQADKPKGRGQKLLPTPVKEIALNYGLRVYQSKSLKTEGFEIIKELKPDIGIVVAYGRILKKPFLDLIPFFNIHASILPKYRGAAPIQRAIENGEKETGITIFKISEGLDDGDVALTKSVEINECETFEQVYEKLQTLGCSALKEFLENYPVPLIPQDHSKATYAPKIEKEDLKVDFSKSVIEVRNKIRAYDPLPGARAIFNLKGEDVEVKLFGACEILEKVGSAGEILEIKKEGAIVGTGDSSLVIKYIQLPSKSKNDFYSLKNGGIIKEGDFLK